MALVNSYAWRNCDGSDSIFVDTNFSAPSDYVYYKGECYFNTYVEVQVENAINPLNGDFFNSCVECHNSTTFVSIPCSLYGQIDIYLSGNIELVLEGQLEGPQLEGQIDIELQGMVDIYLQGLMNDPLLNGELELTLDLEGCFDGEQPITYSVHRTTNCCGGDTHYVSIPSTYQVGDSFIGSDGVCYQIGSLVAGTEPTIEAEYLFEGGCDVCTQQKPCLTPTPTPSPSTQCSSCLQYQIFNNSGSQHLTISYIDCYDSTTNQEFIGTKQTKDLCACEGTIQRVTGSEDFTVTPQGACGISPSPSSTPTATPTPTVTPSQSQIACVGVTRNWTFLVSEACDGIPSNTNVYYGSPTIYEGTVLYGNSNCTTTVPTGRYIVDSSIVFYVGDGGVLSIYDC